MNKTKTLSVILYVIAAYHIVIGIIPFLPSDTAIGLINSIFHMQFAVNDQIIYLGHLFGIYAIMFGLFTGVAAKNPSKHVNIINIAIVLYVLRILNRIFFASMLANAFHVSTGYIWSEIILLAFFGGALLILKPRNN